MHLPASQYQKFSVSSAASGVTMLTTAPGSHWWSLPWGAQVT
jgi:hypothetical protein